LFNSEDNNEQMSFAEAYKSEILNNRMEEESSSKNFIIILLLVAIIIGLGIFGYQYMSNTSQNDNNKDIIEIQEIQEDVDEEVIKPPKPSNMLNNVDELKDDTDNEQEEENPIPKETKVQEHRKKHHRKTYLEQLAELSKNTEEKKEK
jgi:hypothetical protein